MPALIHTTAPAAAEAGAAAEAADGAAAATGGLMARLPLATIWEGGPLRVFAILTYLPLFFLALVVMIAGLRMLRRRREGRPAFGNDTLGILALAGIAYSNFPQFFLFRPDPGHLSFLMPGYFVLAAACLGRWARPAPADAGGEAAAPHRLKRLGLLALGALVGLHFVIYSWLGMNQPAPAR